MNRRTDDPLLKTRDIQMDSGDPDQDVDTQILDVAESSIKTIEMSDSDRKIDLVGRRKDPKAEGTLGGYRILRRIGEGGMGIVYEAEQQQPKRLVALKVIRGGLYASEYHVKMFEREVQALARFKHPGIVSIFEAGRFDDGQVFFAMELLSGESLMEFVAGRENSEAEALSTGEKLQLFEQICSIVSYAHQRGVIHRDLKPQNVFVSDDSSIESFGDTGIEKFSVKVLDFGLARITDPDIVGASDVSQIGQIKGTLNYMSPEQLTGDPTDVDVRSDVYSLGVIFYELLTGRLPYDIRKLTIPEAMRVIAEKLPEPIGGSQMTRLTHSRRGTLRFDKDIETIVLKALEKEPERRYQSVAALMEDIVRYRTDQPILARPPSTAYQFRKLVTRHKAAFASLTSAFLLLLAFGIVMTVQSARLAAERDRAVNAEQTADEQRIEAERLRVSEQKQRVIAEENLRRAEVQQEIAERERAVAETAKSAEEQQRRIAEQSLVRATHAQKRAETQTAVAEQQRAMAAEQKSLAERRQAEAEGQRTLVEEREETNRRLLYASQMNLAHQAWDKSNVTMVEELLQNHVPRSGQADLRGFEWYYFWKLVNQDRWAYEMSAQRVTAGFSLDGKLLMVSTLDDSSDPSDPKSPTTVFLNTETGEETDRIEGHFFLARTGDGKLLTTNGEKDGLVSVFDIKSKQVLSTKITDFWRSPGRFSPDGTLVATINGATVEVRETYSGKIIASFPWKLDHSAEAQISGWSPDGAIIQVSCYDSSKMLTGIFHFYAVTGTPALSEFRTNIRKFSFSADGNTVAFVDGDDLKVLNIKTLREIVVFKDGGRSDLVLPLWGIQFSPDGKQLAVGRGSTVDFFDIEKKQRLGTIKAHGEFLRSFAFSPGGSELATVGFDGKVKLWSLPYSEDSVVIDSAVEYTLSPNGRILATASRDGHLRLWDPATSQSLGVLANREVDPRELLIPPKTPPISEPITIRGSAFLTYSADGTKLARRDQDGVVDFWDVAGRRRVAVSFPGMKSLAFQSEPNIVAVVGPAGRTTLWNLESRHPISSFEATEDGEPEPREFAWSSDGKILAVSFANRIRLLEPATGKKRIADLVVSESPYNLKLSSDGSLLSFSVGRSTRIVDTSTGREIKLQFETDPVIGLPVFSPSGEMLAVVLTRKNVALVDLRTGKQIGVLRGHLGLVASIKFSSDGKRLVTTSVDKTVKIWDTASRQLLISLHSEDLRVVALDGRTLITSGRAGTRIWRGATDVEIASRNRFTPDVQR